MSYKQLSPIPVVEGGTGLVTSTTAYAPICGGITATGAFQAALPIPIQSVPVKV